MSTPLHMRRGIIRLWIATSAAWAAFQLWFSDLTCPLQRAGFHYAGDEWCAFRTIDHNQYYVGLVERALGLPMVLGAAIAVCLWVVSGFAKIKN